MFTVCFLALQCVKPMVGYIPKSLPSYPRPLILEMSPTLALYTTCSSLLVGHSQTEHWVDQSTNFSLDWEFTTFLNHLWYVSSCWTRSSVKAPCWWAGEGWTKSQAASCLRDMKKHNWMNLLLPGSNWVFSYWPNGFPTFVSSLLKGIIRHNHGLNHVLEDDTKMSSTHN
jgi:hypothetical protein